MLGWELEEGGEEEGKWGKGTDPLKTRRADSSSRAASALCAHK